MTSFGAPDRYAHLYPPRSFFAVDSDPALFAAGHHARYSMIWSMIRGEQPPLHLFACSAHAERMAAGQAAQQQQQQAQEDAHSLAQQQAPQQPPHQFAAAAADAPMQDAAHQAKAESHSAAAISSVARPSEAAAEPAGCYSRTTLLALFRDACALPADLTAMRAAAKNSAADREWLAGIVSEETLAPVCASPADALQSALQDELCRDAETTGVSEYAGEWWLPPFGSLAKHSRGGGRGGRGRGGRGGAGGRGRGRGGGGNGGGGWKGQQQEQDDANPNHAARGRKGHKRPAEDRGTAADKPTKRVWADSHLSKLFIGPAAPPPGMLPAAAASTST